MKAVFAGTVISLALGGCGDSSGPPADPCADFVVPARPDTSACGEVDALAPSTLVQCLIGSGHAGLWAVDDQGLPAYDFALEERCDPAAHAYSPRPRPLRDPIHLIGNGRGLVAMAHASGGVEIYSQDRGHKWLNRIDDWSDPTDPEFPTQLGGGFAYLVVDGKVRSTRFEDLPVGEATTRQTRRFGVGYVETVTTWDDLRVTHRVYAPDTDQARALIAEVTVENLTDTGTQVGVIEAFDPNLYELPVELATSDLLNPAITEGIERRRRQLMAGFSQTASYDDGAQALVLATQAKTLPDGISKRGDVSEVDYFPDPMYLAVIDGAGPPDAVWLDDHDLWHAPTDRRPPAALAGAGDASARQVELDGAGQHAFLAARVTVKAPVGSPITRRFAFGYVPGGGSPKASLAALRALAPTGGPASAAAWKDRLVWLAAPGLDSAAVMQREVAWAAYNAQANATFDEYYGVRVLGQGGSYKYVHGLDGAIGDLALFAESMLLVDPKLARETLAYALSTEHGKSDKTPGRFPYATTGVGDYSDVGIYHERSDAYFLVPSEVARYVALTRDQGFLSSQAIYWPRASGEKGSVLDHLDRILGYATDVLGTGARGFVAMGTGDYADGVLSLAGEPATPHGTSSLYNAGFVLQGFRLVADVVGGAQPELAARYQALYQSQADLINTAGWSGTYYYRGFVDSGNPLADGLYFLEPQLFPILAGVVDSTRRDAILDLVGKKLETSIGALSTVAQGGGAGGGGVDKPLVGGVWPVANAWLTEAYAQRSPAEGWSSFARNSLAAHAELYPDLWYGIWTGPDSFNGPDNDRPGEADAHLATALTDYPALNAHIHTSPLRALVALLGVTGDRTHFRIAPRLPTETFGVVWPRLELASTPTSLRGSLAPSGDGAMALELLLPSGLRTGTVSVMIDGSPATFTRTGDLVSIDVVVSHLKRLTFAVAGG